MPHTLLSLPRLKNPGEDAKVKRKLYYRVFNRNIFRVLEENIVSCPFFLSFTNPHSKKEKRLV